MAQYNDWIALDPTNPPFELRTNKAKVDLAVKQWDARTDTFIVRRLVNCSWDGGKRCWMDESLIEIKHHRPTHYMMIALPASPASQREVEVVGLDQDNDE